MQPRNMMFICLLVFSLSNLGCSWQQRSDITRAPRPLPKEESWVKLTPSLVREKGSRVYAAPTKAVVEALVTSLRMSGFKVGIINLDRGVVISEPQEMSRRLVAVRSGERVQMVELVETLRVSAQLTDTGKGIRVSLRFQSAYNGEETDQFNPDLLTQKWNRLFHDLELALHTKPRTTTTNGPRQTI